MFFFRILLLFSCFISASYAVDSGNAIYICQHIGDSKDFEQCLSKVNETMPGSPNSSSGGFSLLNFLWPWAWWVGFYCFAVLLATFVYRDAKSREWLLFQIPPVLWFLVVVFEPAVGIIAYWLAHYSGLSVPPKELAAKSADT